MAITTNGGAGVTADAVATLSNKTLEAPVINNATFTGAQAGLEIKFGNNIVLEGTTNDAFEMTLSGGDPTADRTVTLPDATGQVVLRDTADTLTNKTLTNPVINNFVLGYTTTATAAGTTTLTSTSNNQQVFTGTTTQTVVMPVASTMVAGTRFVIENNSTGIVTVQSSGLNTIVAIPSNMSVKVLLITASGTNAASWDFEYIGYNALTGTGSAVFATSPSISGLTLTGSLTAGGSTGTNGYYLQTTGSGVQWAAAAADPTRDIFMLMGA